MKKRTDQYNELDDQFTALKTAFQEIVDNTELQGKGADNIKRFYQAQIKLVGDWQDVIEGLTGFFESIPGRMEDADLNNRTKVAVPFLEEQLQSGADKSRQMVDQQHSELGKILDTIRDILPISSFSLDSFKKNMEEADKERAGAAQAVIGFDEGYLGVYYLNALSNLEGVSAGYDAIRSATSSGDGTIQPIHFNQKIYDEHIVHDVRESVEEKLDSFKYEEKKLKEFRIEKAKMEEEMAKIKAEQEKPAHEKIFSGITTVAGELTGVNDIIRATTGVDPVTGNKLTEAERVKAAGMAAAGFIPVVGWGGRAARGVYKGGKAIEGMVTADRALDAYKTTAGMQKLAQAEKGIYGLTVANSGYEFTSGRDMFGNKLTEEQRNNAMWESFGLVGSPFLARGVTKLTSKLPHNPAFVQNQINKAKQAVPTPSNWVSQPHRNTFAKPEVKKPVVNNIGKRTTPNASAVSPPSASINKSIADSGAAPVNKVESKPQTGPGLGKKVDPVKEQEVRSQPKVVNGRDVPVVGPVKPEVKEVPKSLGNGKIEVEQVVPIKGTGETSISKPARPKASSVKPGVREKPSASKKQKGKRLSNEQLNNLVKGNFVKETSRTRTFTPETMPGSKDFAKWFNELSIDEFELAWSTPKLRTIIESRIRYPGGYHEWHLVSRAPIFKRWGVTAEDIAEMRTLTKDVEFINPVGRHGFDGSGKAHRELLDLIDHSLDYETFKRKLRNWAHYRLKGGIDSLPEGLR